MSFGFPIVALYRAGRQDARQCHAVHFDFRTYVVVEKKVPCAPNLRELDDTVDVGNQ